MRLETDDPVELRRDVARELGPDVAWVEARAEDVVGAVAPGELVAEQDVAQLGDVVSVVGQETVHAPSRGRSVEVDQAIAGEGADMLSKGMPT